MYHVPANSNDDEISKEEISKQIRDYKRSIRLTIDPKTGKKVTLMTKKQIAKEIDSDIEGI